MKLISFSRIISALATVLIIAGCATTPPVASIDSPTIVQAACGECKLGMKGDSCDLAIVVAGHKYFVDGVKDEALGDAHAKDGICQMIRKARVTGKFEKGRFVASTFELLPSGQ